MAGPSVVHQTIPSMYMYTYLARLMLRMRLDGGLRFFLYFFKFWFVINPSMSLPHSLGWRRWFCGQRHSGKLGWAETT